MRPLPDYVDLQCRLVARGPYVQTGTRLHSFRTRGDRVKLEAVCDRWFNSPSGGALRYVPLVEDVFVSFADIASVQSGDPVDRDRGRVAEKDVTVWLLLWRTRPSALLPRWLPIHLFVDSAPALITGREVFGFPKEIGRFQFAPGLPAKGEFACETFGFERRDPGGFARWLEVLRVRPKPQASAGPGRTWSSLDEFFAWVGSEIFELGALERLPGFASLDQLLGLWPLGLVKMVFLKQLPSVEDNGRAVHQAVVEASAGVTAFRGAGLTDISWELDCRSWASHPFFDEMGIAPGFHDVGPALWVDFDFVMQLGQPVWEWSA